MLHEKYTSPEVEQSRPGADDQFGVEREAMVWDDWRGNPSAGCEEAKPGDIEPYPDTMARRWSPKDREEGGRGSN